MTWAENELSLLLKKMVLCLILGQNVTTHFYEIHSTEMMLYMIQYQINSSCVHIKQRTL